MSSKKNRHPVVMIIGGMDPSGGAGLCADIQTLSAFGCHAAPVVTAVTVQNTVSVRDFQAIDATRVRAQMQAVFDDFYPVVVKTGMLANRETVIAVSNFLAEYPEIEIVVDPVMRSNTDVCLSEDSLSRDLKEYLFPLASLITPNLPEACALAEVDANADDCAARLKNVNCLITGTHAESRQVTNRYYRFGKKEKEWHWPRLKFEYHGSGCTLASAIAAGLAHGRDEILVLEQAQQYVIESLQAGFRPGQGQHIPDRLCQQAWNTAKEAVNAPASK